MFKEQEDDEDDRLRPEGVPIGACAAGEFQCIGGSRRCIPGVKKCNREYDCQVCRNRNFTAISLFHCYYKGVINEVD